MPKQLFYCDHCQENRYGEVTQDNVMADKTTRIRVFQCGTCNKYTFENTKLIVNIHSIFKEINITDGAE